MTTAASSLVAAAISVAVLGAFALITVRARRRASLRLSAALAQLGARIDTLSAELGTALERVERADRLSRTLGEHAEWLQPANVAARAAEAAAELANADAGLIRVRDETGSPLVATCGLASDAVDEDALDWPPGDTRAVALDFRSTNGGAPEFRSGLAVPIEPSGDSPAFLAVFWRDVCIPGEGVVGDLEALAARIRPLLDRDGPPPTVTRPAVDELTGLAGRLAFHAALAEHVARARSGDGRFALLVVDVDGFGSLNERIGQLAADAVLLEVANRLRESVGNDGLGCRIGSDRFALILPHGTHGDAELVFARLQAALRRSPPENASRITVSGGIAVLENGEDPLVVFDRARSALRRAKDVARGSAVVAVDDGH